MASHTAKERATQIKEEGNALFREKQYDAAIEKYTRAIALDEQNAIFYSNRASCYLALERHQEAINDSKRALQIDTRYPKAWLRLGDGYAGLTRYAESIEAYERALSIPGGVQTLLKDRIESITEKIVHPDHVSLEMLIVCARAHSISIPNKDDIKTRSEIENLRKYLRRHPKWGSEPLVRLLYIPQNEREPIRNIELDKDDADKYQAELRRLLDCDLTTAVLLYSEDQMAYAKEKPNGVGLGRIHSSYEAYMDDNANNQKPLNRRASSLLCRPNTHGPILVMKTNFIKANNDVLGRASDILGWEKLSVEELKSNDFKRKRTQWMQAQQQGVSDLMSHGFQVLNL